MGPLPGRQRFLHRQAVEVFLCVLELEVGPAVSQAKCKVLAALNGMADDPAGFRVGCRSDPGLHGHACVGRVKAHRLGNAEHAGYAKVERTVGCRPIGLGHAEVRMRAHCEFGYIRLPVIIRIQQVGTRSRDQLEVVGDSVGIAVIPGLPVLDRGCAVPQGTVPGCRRCDPGPQPGLGGPASQPGPGHGHVLHALAPVPEHVIRQGRRRRHFGLNIFDNIFEDGVPVIHAQLKALSARVLGILQCIRPAVVVAVGVKSGIDHAVEPDVVIDQVLLDILDGQFGIPLCDHPRRPLLDHYLICNQDEDFL